MLAGIACWDSPASTSAIETIDASSLGARLPAFITDSRANGNWAAWPVTRDLRREDAFGKACDFLAKKSREIKSKLEAVTIAGYGPFEKTNEPGVMEFSRLSARADAPFAGYPVLDFVTRNLQDSKILNMTSNAKVYVIADVAAMGIATYWCDWLDAGNAEFKTANVVAAFIVGHGIGGAVVQRQGEIVGQNHHAEMGEIPVRVHPADGLIVAESLFRRDCLASRAGSGAMKQRIAPYRTLSQAGEDMLHPAWDIETYYLAQMCQMAVYTSAPTRIVLGGSLIEQAPRLIDRTRYSLSGLVRGTLNYPQLDDVMSLVQGIDRHGSMLMGALLHSLKQTLTIEPKADDAPAKFAQARSYAKLLSDRLVHDRHEAEPPTFAEEVKALLEGAGLPTEQQQQLIESISRLAFDRPALEDSMPERATERWDTRTDQKEKIHHFIMRVYGRYLATGAFTRKMLERLDPTAMRELNRWEDGTKSAFLPR